MQRSWGRAVPTCTRDGKEASMAGLIDGRILDLERPQGPGQLAYRPTLCWQLK